MSFKRAWEEKSLVVVFIPKGVKKGIVEGAAVCRKESKQSREGEGGKRGAGEGRCQCRRGLRQWHWCAVRAKAQSYKVQLAFALKVCGEL